MPWSVPSRSCAGSTKARLASNRVPPRRGERATLMDQPGPGLPAASARKRSVLPRRAVCTQHTTPGEQDSAAMTISTLLTLQPPRGVPTTYHVPTTGVENVCTVAARVLVRAVAPNIPVKSRCGLAPDADAARRSPGGGGLRQPVRDRVRAHPGQ